MTDQPIEIVLVEDNPFDVELTLAAFKAHHVVNNIKVLNDGEEALSYIFANCEDSKSACPHLILLDLKLPKVDGLEVLKRLRSDERTKLVPIVILTSSAEERDRLESYKLGANSYLVKPVEFDDFSRMVREIGLYWILMNRPPF